MIINCFDKGRDVLKKRYSASIIYFVFVTVLTGLIFIFQNSKADTTVSQPSPGIPVTVSEVRNPSGMTMPAMPVNNSARAAVVIDARNGRIIMGRNMNERLPMASTTKIMTALVVLEHMDVKTNVKISAESVTVEGSSIYLMEGETITVENLLYGLLLESGNDAAMALAIATAKSEEAFVKLMNDKARELGLSDTRFENPHGLSNENHYTTAYELALITKEAMKNELFRKIVSEKKKLVPISGAESSRLFVNHNRLLRLYGNAIGVKTGFTKAAGRCLVSAAQDGNEMYIAVTLNDGNDWNDHISMMNYAFENYDSVCVAKAGELEYKLNIQKIPKKSLVIKNREDLYFTIKKGEEVSYSLNVDLSNDDIFHVAEGDTVGVVSCNANNGEQLHGAMIVSQVLAEG